MIKKLAISTISAAKMISRKGISTKGITKIEIRAKCRFFKRQF